MAWTRTSPRRSIMPSKRQPTSSTTLRGSSRERGRYSDRQLFMALKDCICRAEQSLTFELLRKLSPAEASLLRDPTLKARIRFRFGGCEFPPAIYYKIYTKADSVQYITGKKVIKAGTQAAADACKMMGNRKFLGQVMEDAYKSDKPTEDYDVATIKDYMQYSANLDNNPAFLGGRENGWRELNLEAGPSRNSVVRQPRNGIRQSSMRQPMMDPAESTAGGYKRSTNKSKTTNEATRRSQKARERVDKMRKLYGLGEDGSRSGTYENNTAVIGEDDPEEWEEEAASLFEWSQDLTYDAYYQEWGTVGLHSPQGLQPSPHGGVPY
eukprot:Opistho-2@37396